MAPSAIGQTVETGETLAVKDASVSLEAPETLDGLAELPTSELPTPELPLADGTLDLDLAQPVETVLAETVLAETVLDFPTLNPPAEMAATASGSGLVSADALRLTDTQLDFSDVAAESLSFSTTPQTPAEMASDRLSAALDSYRVEEVAVAPGAPGPSNPGQSAPTIDRTDQIGQIAQTDSSGEPRVLVSEVVVRDDSGALLPDLEALVYEVITTRPGRTTTSSRLQDDVNAIYATGFFGRVEPLAEETPLGVRVIFVVRQNPEFNAIELRNNQVLTQEIVDAIFSNQYGRTLNLRDFQSGVEAINRWYDENGFSLAQVIDPPPIPETGPIAPPPVSPDGTIAIDVAEGEIEAIRIRYLNEDGEEFDEEGEPVEGRTRPFIITREMQTQAGGVFNGDQIQADLQRIFGLGLFEDVNLSVEPGTDPRKAILTINAIEGRSGSVAAGGGFSSSSGFFGTLSYQEQNLGGNAQRLGAEVQVGTRGLFFDANFTDPWIAGDPYRTSYNVNLFKRRSISLVFDSADDQQEIDLVDNEDSPLTSLAGYSNDAPDGDRPRIDRLGGGITFSRPLTRDVFDTSPSWRASLGLRVQEVSIRDADGEITPRDEGDVVRVARRASSGEVVEVREVDGNYVDSAGSVVTSNRDDTERRIREGSQRRLAFNDDGTDFLATVRLGLSYDGRDDRLNPTSGSRISVSTEQALPFDGIFYNSVQASYSYFMPVDFTSFTDGAETLAFNVRGGTILGDFPPYEAFILGGVNSVRGYEEGAIGSGRSFVQASAEYRFPILSFLSGVVFLDAASDLGTGDNVPGNPAGARDKPGSGFGYGLGLRINSPIGPIRVDLGLNDEGDNRFHFGIGQRF